ncbi:MAG: NADH-quinone oxidoreductase subunit A [Gemmataceae bacterium]
MTVLVGYILLFVFIAWFFVIFHLLLGKLLRPARPTSEKAAIYECGEPTVGPSWIQFDVRYYVIALLFIIFDVEITFFFPWAVVFGHFAQLANPGLSESDRQAWSHQLLPAGEHTQISAEAALTMSWITLLDLLVFFGVLLVGFAYLWARGDLHWVRSVAAQRMPEMPQPPPEVLLEPELAESR